MKPTHKLELTEETVNLALIAMGELKYKVAAKAIAEIVEQLKTEEATPPPALTVVDGKETA